MRWFLLFLFITQTFLASSQDIEYYKMPEYAGPEAIVPSVIIFKLKAEAAHFIKSSEIHNVDLQNVLNDFNATTPSKIFPSHRAPSQKYHSSGQQLVDLSLIFETTIGKDEQLDLAINSLYATGLVEYAQPRYIPSLLHTPNDPMIGSQYYLDKIQAYDAWDISMGDTTVVIGITDTGIDLNHPDLINSIKYNYNDTINGEDSDNDGFIDNFYGWNLGGNNNNTQYQASAHGVHVSGIAAATPDNGTGIAGVGFNSKVLPVKIDDELGKLVKAYEGIVYAADQGAQVINCSWGGTIGAGQFGQDIVNYAALNCDAVVIAAAGNSFSQVPFYPASYDNVLSVAATNANDIKWENSSYGILVDVSAPGANLLSTWINGTYISSSGTSMAAPVVAGAAAIMRHHFPDYSSSQIKAQIKVTTDNIDTIPANSDYEGLLGTGRINLYRALTETHHPYIRLTHHVLTQDEFAAMEPGATFQLSSFFQNLLAPTGNITATLSSQSPFVEISNSQISLGAIATNQIVDNVAEPFIVNLLSDLPASHSVVFTITFTNENGDFAGQQIFSILFNVDYVNVSINDISTTITSKGTLGYNYPDYSQGQGFIYKEGLSLIRNAGLVIGSSSSKVVDNIYGATEGSFNQFLVSEQNAHIVSQPLMGDIQIAGTFTDADAGVFKLDVKVDYSAYFWNNAPHNKYVILEYKIINQSSSAFTGLYTGFFADWTIRDNKNHRAAFDADNRMGYAWSALGGHYSGVGLLTEGNIRHYAFDNEGFAGSINISDGFTSFEKYTALRTNRLNAGLFDKDNDISTLLSTGPYFLAPDDTLTVAFVMLAGDHLADIQWSAQAAYRKYYGIDDDPLSSNNVVTGSDFFLNIFPNPAINSATLAIDPPYSGMMKVTVADISGNILISQNVMSLKGSPNNVNINTSDLPAGIYVVTIAGNGFAESRPFIRLDN